MTPALALMLFAALLVGVLIGCVGIGGVLLPPAHVDGLGFHLAAATSVWAFLFCGAAGTLSYSRRRSIDWRMAAWLGRVSSRQRLRGRGPTSPCLRAC